MYKVDGGGTHNTIHIQVQVVEFYFIGIGTRDVDRYRDILSFSLNLDFLFFDYRKNCVKSNQTYGLQ